MATDDLIGMNSIEPTTFVHRCVASLEKSPLPPFAKGGAQRTGDLLLQTMCTNLVWSDLACIGVLLPFLFVLLDHWIYANVVGNTVG
jgi:hypothetical protein